MRGESVSVVGEPLDPWLGSQLASLRSSLADPGPDLPRAIAESLDRLADRSRRRVRRTVGAGCAAALVVAGAVVRTRRPNP